MHGDYDMVVNADKGCSVPIVIAPLTRIAPGLPNSI